MFGKKNDLKEVVKERLLSVEKNQVFEKFAQVPEDRYDEAKEYYLELFEKFRKELEEEEYETIKDIVKAYLSEFKKFVDHVNYVFNSKVEDAVEIARELLAVAEEFESFDEAVREYLQAKEEALLSRTEEESAEAY